MKIILPLILSIISSVCFCQQEYVFISTGDIGVQQMMQTEKNRKHKIIYSAYAVLKFKKDTATIIHNVEITGLEEDSVYQLPQNYRSLKLIGIAYYLNFDDPNTKPLKTGQNRVTYDDDEVKKFINPDKVFISVKEVLENRPGGLQAMHVVTREQRSYLTGERKVLDCTIAASPAGTPAEVYLVSQKLWNQVYKMDPPLEENSIKASFLKYIKKRRIGNTFKTITIPLADEPYYIIFEHNGGFLGNVLDPADSKDHSFTYPIK